MYGCPNCNLFDETVSSKDWYSLIPCVLRVAAAAAKAADILKDGGVNRPLAKEVYPQYASQIDSMSDEEIRTGLEENIADSTRYRGYKYMLMPTIKRETYSLRRSPCSS